MKIKKINLGTRGSALALWQTNYIAKLLKEKYSEFEFFPKIIKTSGDKIQNISLSKIGDKGLFTKELEEKLLSGEIDMAIHSLKDLPTTLPDELIYIASPKRVDYRDTFLSFKYQDIKQLPKNAIIATGSLRRKAQIKSKFPNTQFKDLRGNIDTRIQKLKDNNYDGIVMAAAAIKRLEVSADGLFVQELDSKQFIPAVSQGAIGIEIRKDNQEIKKMLQSINDKTTYITCLAERAFMRKLEGGCTIPIGAVSQIKNNQIELIGYLSDIDGENIITEKLIGDINFPEQVGKELANIFLEKGGRQILDTLKNESQ